MEGVQLSNDGLVDIFPQKGTRVSLIDLKRVEEEWFIRKSLEESEVQIFWKNILNILSMRMLFYKNKFKIKFRGDKNELNK